MPVPGGEISTSAIWTAPDVTLEPADMLDHTDVVEEVVATEETATESD